MTTSIPYWHVDAFTDRPFAGNQAAVMQLAERLDDAVLQAIATEHLFADTAFLVPDASSVADWELCWFTPTVEVKLCGHATLASGHVLLTLAPERDAVRFRTRHAGVLEVRRLGQGYELALPAIATAPGSFPEAVMALGAEPREIWRSPAGYTLLVFDGEDQIRALRPDLRMLARLGDEQFIATAPGRETDVVSRVFVPGGGIDEDSVTGSAHAALTPFWTQRLGRKSFTAYQASKRGGRVSCRLDGKHVWLGGDCVTVVEGTFFL
ncbi:PhzF family phenazine biosynthesis protein [Novosphingobium sp. G106]|uniref:PhzF family phenazine biosynthesis protein n=1 Tax=Novosphingobium sp. G106 TaxID=2849500 RepID=UPI001C2D229A|nr:PhzF family phenazine biosynthesis protein [Novosphingobium sp. G106]MBV1690047.1 PhzF family phenazine biosynthesis protein [Novosphingobium sp. G106]